MKKAVQCELCPKACVIAPGQSGECRIRVNIDGRLAAVTYGHPCSAHVDPVEKKPLFHFLPGTGILSLATVGCNLHCKNCQNWEISQENPENVAAKSLPPEQVPRVAKEAGCLSVAYTYTEPIAYYEYTLDSCMKVKEAGLKNVLVTAGYINKAPWEDLCQYVDAANIDVKAMSDQFYRDIAGGTLAPVLNSCIAARSLGVMVELTNLVIPTLNDSDEDITKLCRWVAGNMGKETPLHFSRFFPHYQMKNLPPTPGKTLDRAREIALSEGLYNIYIGNISREGAENTYCHVCGNLLVARRGYVVGQNHIRPRRAAAGPGGTRDLFTGECPFCNAEVFGLWQ